MTKTSSCAKLSSRRRPAAVRSETPLVATTTPRSIDRQRRVLQHPMTGISGTGALLRIPARAVVMPVLVPRHEGFAEVLYAGRIVRVPASELDEASSPAPAPRNTPLRRRRGD